jgi:hypothetical protein
MVIVCRFEGRPGGMWQMVIVRSAPPPPGGGVVYWMMIW